MALTDTQEQILDAALACFARAGVESTRLRDVAQDLEERATGIIVMQNGLWLNWARHRNRRDLNRSLERCVERTR